MRAFKKPSVRAYALPPPLIRGVSSKTRNAMTALVVNGFRGDSKGDLMLPPQLRNAPFAKGGCHRKVTGGFLFSLTTLERILSYLVMTVGAELVSTQYGGRHKVCPYELNCVGLS